MLIKGRQSSSGISIDMTPMIDMVFLLLIFFLVATTFHQEEREMRIALPLANAAGPISVSLRELIINVDVEGGIVVGGRQITPEDLSSVIQEAVEVNPDQKVSVRGDKATAYANVVRVLDICKSNGIQEPYLDTVLEK
ncbi:MAG: biopolymer transporter ExbD [Planctomycetota bacterium]|nr:biopolymer transporter ExbD [Planctomycetota bacterium]